MTCTRRCSAVLLIALTWTQAALALPLGEALMRALERDPAMAVSLAQYAADRQLSREERGSLLPSLGAGAKYDLARTETESVLRTAPAENYHHWQAAITARQPVFRYDWLARLDRAEALDVRANASAAERRLQIMQRLADRYFNVLLAQDALRHAEAEAQVLRGSLEDTRKRYEVELVPGTDLKEAQARDDLAQARLLSARRELETALDALEEVVGMRPAVLPRLPENFQPPPLQPREIEAWVREATEHSPALTAARQAVRVAAANRKSRWSEALPAVDLVAQASHLDSTDYSLGQKQEDQRVGVELNLPLYAGGVRQARIRRAEAELQGAEAELARLTVELERRVRQLYREAETRYSEIEALARSLASALAAQQATQAGYEAGTRTITDVLDAKSRVVQARRELNGGRYTLLLTLLQLKQQVGVLSPNDFAEVDRLLQVASVPAAAPDSPDGTP